MKSIRAARPLRARSCAVLMTSLLAFTTGCPSSAIRDRGRVQSEWSRTLRELGIVPTFPPREDFYVGDLYVTHYDPNSEEVEDIFLRKWDDLNADEKRLRREIGMQVRLMHLDLSEALKAEYANRLSAPSSGFDPGRTDDIPAVVASAAKFQAARAAVEAKEKEIATASAGINNAKAAVDTATVAVATAKTAQTRKSEDVIAALRAEETNARNAAAISAQEVIEAQRKFDVETDAARKKELELALANAKSKSALDQAKLNAATANVSAAVAAGASNTALAAEITATRNAETALETAKAALDQATKAAQPQLDKFNAELIPLKAKVEEVKGQHEQVLAAAKLLNASQPAYPNRNVFTGAKFADDEAGNRSNLSRLRIVAFPDFVTANFTGADAAAMIPIEAANLGIGLSSQDVSGVNVKIPSAESYALPVSTMMDKVVTTVGTKRSIHADIAKALKTYPEPAWVRAPETATGDSRKPQRSKSATTQPGDGEAKEKLVYVTVISEVFYARAMDISVNYSQAGAARVTASLPGTTQPAGAAIGQTDSLQSLLNNVQSKVGQTQTVPGGSIQIVSGSSFGVGLRRTFDRPVAVGYRGFTLVCDVSKPDQPSLSRIDIRSTLTPQMINRLKSQPR